MVLVDIFDTYDKVERDFVDKSQLDMRMHMLKLGTMKTDIAKVTWNYWKKTRSQNFIDWFEKEIYDEAVSEEGFDKNNIEIYGYGFRGEASLASPWQWYNYLFAFGGDLFDSEYNIAIDSP